MVNAFKNYCKNIKIKRVYIFSLFVGTIIGLLCYSSVKCYSNDMSKSNKNILNMRHFKEYRGLLCYWDFNGKQPLVSKGKYRYRLREGKTPVSIVDGGPFSGKSISLTEGQYLYIPRSECPALNLHGKNAQVTVLAWVKRKPKNYIECEAIAGMWNETEKKRQYCLFINIQLYNSADQVSGHVSGVGGPTPGNRWCVDVSIGKQKVNFDEWTFIGFSYDSKKIKSYYNGLFDVREGTNPYDYKLGLFNGEKEGSDFTVGAVNRSGVMGNFFAGQIGMLAIFDRALSDNEIMQLSSLKMI